VRVRSFVDFLLEQLRRHPDLAADSQALIAPYVREAAPARPRRSAPRR
jgi:hypothetical protein